MKKTEKFSWTCIAVLTALFAMWLFYGCGGGGDTTPSAATETSPVATVPTDSQGNATTTQSATTATPNSSVTIPQGTTLQDGQGNPVSGDVNMVVQYFPAAGNLPISAPPEAQAVYGAFAVTMQKKGSSQKVTDLVYDAGAANDKKPFVEIKLNNVPDGTKVQAWCWKDGKWQWDGEHIVLKGKIKCFITKLLLYIFGFFPTGVTGGTGGCGLGGDF